MSCVNCAAKIEEHLLSTPGVRFANVNFAAGILTIDANDSIKTVNIVHSIEPDVELSPLVSGDIDNDKFYRQKEIRQIVGSVVLFILGIVISSTTSGSLSKIISTGFIISAYLYSGWRVLRSAYRNIFQGNIFDENFLMSISTIGAIAIGEVHEAAGVMLFYQIGEYLQNLAVNRSRKSVHSLLESKPSQARLLAGEASTIVSPDIVAVGDLILVKPGEKIPLDGDIIHGSSFIDTSPLTGESAHEQARIGSQVLAGTINQNGVIRIRVSKELKDSSITRVMELVESATDRKASPEKFITRFARVYSPIVFFVAAGIAIIPPLFFSQDFSTWLYRALVVLVISCPCALVISIPLSYFAGIGAASRHGILVKGSNFLDVLATAKTIIFDKTGTLTRGVFKVADVNPAEGFTKAELLDVAAVAESHSNHPIAQSIQAAVSGSFDITVDEYTETPGMGVMAIVNGDRYQAGNDAYLHKENVPHTNYVCEIDGTVIHVAAGEKYAGNILIADEPRPGTKEAIEQLRNIGVEHISMLTGDNELSARPVAENLALDSFEAGLMPEDKVFIVEQMMQSKNGSGKIVFVGDGINDTPALARADAGIAMGALGSQAAIEVADIVVMSESLEKIPLAIKIAKKTRMIVWQNITLALLVKLVFISLGVLGHATMWQAVFADMGVALLAVFNAIRILR